MHHCLAEIYILAIWIKYNASEKMALWAISTYSSKFAIDSNLGHNIDETFIFPAGELSHVLK